jgi:hypothetical protein
MQRSIDFSIRECILGILRSLYMPEEYRVNLSSAINTMKVSIIFERKNGFFIPFGSYKLYLFSWWAEERVISEFSYEDLLEKICKYPMLLETTVTISSNSRITKLSPARVSELEEAEA